jgi:hypothetical protein
MRRRLQDLPFAKKHQSEKKKIKRSHLLLLNNPGGHEEIVTS